MTLTPPEAISAAALRCRSIKDGYMKRIALYAVSTLLVVFGAVAFQHAPNFSTMASVYFSVAFFTVAGLDFWRTQVKEDGQSEVAVYANAGRHCPGVCLDRYGFVRVPYFGERCEHEQNTPAPAQASAGSGFADRFLGYLFAAPFIFPAKVYELVTSRG